MNVRTVLLLLLSGPLLCAGCTILSRTYRSELGEGYYRRKSGRSRQWFYVVPDDDTIAVYPVSGKGKAPEATGSSRYTRTDLHQAGNLQFVRNTLDLDVLTIPVKYRPPVEGFPNQFNTTFNGAVYLGYRTDRYRVSFQRTPLNTVRKATDHLGYGLGVFLGPGATPVNPWVTRNRIPLEYDGVILSKGLAAIAVINNLNFGLGIGFDHLLDPNRRAWIYQGRPWAGLTVSLNLN